MRTGTSGAEGPSTGRVVLAFAAVYLIWGSTYLGIGVAAETIPPFLMVSARFLVAGAVMYLWARSQGAPRPTRPNWLAALLIGGLLLMAGNGGVAWAEERGLATGLAALLVAASPLWMVLLEWRLEGKRPTARVALGLVIGFAGLAVLIGPSSLLGGGAVDLVAASVVLLASLSWAFGSVISRRVPLPASPIMASGTEMLGAGGLLLLLGTALGEWGRLDPAGISTRSLLALLYLIVFGSLVGFTAFVWLLRHVEIAKVSTYAYVNPVVAVILGWALADEPLTARTAAAAAVIVLGVVFITRGKRERPPVARGEAPPAGAVLAAGD